MEINGEENLWTPDEEHVFMDNQLLLARRRSPLGKIPKGYYLAQSKHLRNVHDGTPIQGLFTDHLLANESLVGEYRGKILSEEESDNKRGGTRVYYFQISDNHGKCIHVIDGAPHRQSSFLRYVNAPNKQNEANCAFQQLRNHILLYTSQEIPAHTELTAWYGPNTADIIWS